jgi:ETFB lysine methyltransferase
LIIGSDILYQPAHAEHVSRFISRHSSNDVDILITDPGGEVRPRFTRAMRALGYDYRFEKFDEPVHDNQRCHGWTLHYHRQFSID